jgi:hypothetical protein
MAAREGLAVLVALDAELNREEKRFPLALWLTDAIDFRP